MVESDSIEERESDEIGVSSHISTLELTAHSSHSSLSLSPIPTRTFGDKPNTRCPYMGKFSKAGPSLADREGYEVRENLCNIIVNGAVIGISS
jgi:hypothetical protein